ncbi:MAG: histidinol-phosphatase [Actinomycetota bacterium]|nr:histidinol-phosphatase [Actinomycetota bacterium]
MPTDQSIQRDDDLAVALRLADAADAISLPRFGAADLRVQSKPDLTPVSDADLAVERVIRDLLASERPTDSILGEEYGDSRPGAHRRWVIDPIDGTKNFVRGVPIWATLIGLVDGDQIVVGVVSAPALARRWWAADGAGAFGTFNGGDPRRLQTSAVTELADASLAYSDYSEWDAAGRGPAFRALADGCWRTRGYGDFYPYMLVAEGAVDIAAEPELSVWDIAALVPIVTEAGGRFSQLDGSRTGPSPASAVASNGPLHQIVIDALNPSSGTIATEPAPHAQSEVTQG